MLVLPNVASVPQYSPLRYPGGKSRWYPFVKKWISGRKKRGPAQAEESLFVEPFAGGAHAGIAAGVEGLVSEVKLAEKAEGVSSFWATVFETKKGGEWLAGRVESLPRLGRREAERVFADAENGGSSRRARALAYLVRNRISRGGITATGAGILGEGKDGEKLSSRWYPKTLSRRIRFLTCYRSRFSFRHQDGFDLIRKHLSDPGAFLFIDPPYPGAGDRLYEHSAVDHERLFALAEEARGSVLMTYDTSEEAKALASESDLESVSLLTSTTHHLDKRELLIGQDLRWVGSLSRKYRAEGVSAS